MKIDEMERDGWVIVGDVANGLWAAYRNERVREGSGLCSTLTLPVRAVGADATTIRPPSIAGGTTDEEE